MQLPTVKLYDDLVQAGALAQGLHSRGHGIAVDLFYRLVPLLLYSLLVGICLFVLFLPGNEFEYSSNRYS